MSCYHRYPHGCGWPVAPPDYFEERAYPSRDRDRVVVVRDEDDPWAYARPPRRRGRSGDETSVTAERADASSLRTRAEALRAELDRIERELADLAGGPEHDTQV